mgnify:FL=1
MAQSFLSALGKDYDISPWLIPVDSQGGANTGFRISMQNCRGIGIWIIKNTGTTTDYLVPIVSEHTAYTGGTTAALAVVTKFWTRSEASLDGDEAWVANTQAASGTVTWNSLLQSQIYFEIMADQLSDGYTHISVSAADTGSAGAMLMAGAYIQFGLKTQRIPSNLPNPLNPGTANA